MQNQQVLWSTWKLHHNPLRCPGDNHQSTQWTPRSRSRAVICRTGGLHWSSGPPLWCQPVLTKAILWPWGGSRTLCTTSQSLFTNLQSLIHLLSNFGHPPFFFSVGCGTRPGLRPQNVFPWLAHHNSSFTNHQLFPASLWTECRWSLSFLAYFQAKAVSLQASQLQCWFFFPAWRGLGSMQ